MKKHFRAAIFVGVLSSMLAGYSSAPAYAHAKHLPGKQFNEKVRVAQMKLADLGYFVGYSDGVLGSKTKKAIRNYQHMHSLHADGRLTDKTFESICMTDYMAHHYYLASYTTNAGASVYNGYPYNQPGRINPENGAWVVSGHNR